MAQDLPQSYATHARWDPKFHFFLIPLLLLLFLFTAYLAWRHTDGVTLSLLVLVIAVIVNAFTTRLYSLRVQERVIRLEERLRLATLLPQHMHARINDLTETLCSVPAFLLRLHVAEGSDPEGLIRYWGKGGRGPGSRDWAYR